MMKKSNPEDEVIVKFVDEDFEQLLISKCKNVDSITEVLNKYQKEEMSYNWDDFLLRLKEAHIKFKTLRVVEYYF